MRTKHTPGPWHQGVGGYQYCVYDKKCWVNPDGSRGGDTPNLVVVVSPESAVADARLIAAAPELLAVLRDCLPFIDDANDIAQFFPESAATNACRGAVKRAHEIIDKATGLDGIQAVEKAKEGS